MREGNDWRKKDQIKEELSGMWIGGAMGKAMMRSQKTENGEVKTINKMSKITNFEVMKT